MRTPPLDRHGSGQQVGELVECHGDLVHRGRSVVCGEQAQDQSLEPGKTVACASDAIVRASRIRC
jgi:hypothetical protein